MRIRLPIIKTIFWLALLAVVVLFVTQNAQVVELHFLVWRLAMSESLLLFLVLAVGFGLGWIFRAFLAWKRASSADSAVSSRDASQDNKSG